MTGCAFVGFNALWVQALTPTSLDLSVAVSFCLLITVNALDSQPRCCFNTSIAAHAHTHTHQTRVCLQSTLIKILTSELKPNDGGVTRHPNLRVAYVAQVRIRACMAYVKIERVMLDEYVNMCLS